MVYHQRSRIKTALIGCGYWGSKLRRYIEQDNNFSLEYVCDSKSDLDEVWKDKEVTAVIVATPNNTHYSMVKAALLHGKDVLAEKPLAMKGWQGEELEKIALEQGAKLLTEYTYTFSPGVKKAIELVEKGEIGTVLGFDMSVKHLGRFGGGSVYWLLGSHLLAVLDMFVPLGELEFHKRDLVVCGGEVEAGVISFGGGGVVGQLNVSLNYPGKETRIVIYGDRGTLVYNPMIQPSLWIETYEKVPWVIGSKLPKNRQDYEIDEADNLRYAIEYFGKVIRDEAESNIERAVQITKTIEGLQDKEPVLISICIPCMNRTYDLKKTMPHIIRCANASPPVEILVLNYGSRDDLDEYIKTVWKTEQLAEGNFLSYVKFPATYYHVAHAHNLSSLASRGEFIIPFLADLIPSIGFVSHVRRCLEADEDLVWMKTSHSVIVCKREEYIASGGYDERFEFYSPGWEDLNMRLHRRGGRYKEYPRWLCCDGYVTPLEEKWRHFRPGMSRPRMTGCMQRIFDVNQKNCALVANEGKAWGQATGPSANCGSLMVNVR